MTDKKKDCPFVFVRCLTYNHEKYIDDALKGFVMQKTDFPFLAVVIDDCSTDGTADIVRRYEAQYPDKIKGIYLPHNFRQSKEDKRPYYQEYIDKATYWAECEGDDYWTDPYKLQKQVDFLEAHPDYVACCHNAMVILNGRRTLFNTLYESNNPTTKEIIERDWFIPTASMIYRHKLVKYPSWSTQIINTDYLLVLLLAQQGKIYYMQDVMSVYRKHQDGMSYAIQRDMVKFNDGMIRLMTNTKELYGGEYADSFDRAIQKYEKRREDTERELKYPWLKYLNWRTYKRMIFAKLRIKRV